MTRTLAAAASAAVLVLASVAFAAAEPAPITSGSATWTTDDKVELKVTYEGGACEQPGDARVDAATDTTDAVTIPTTTTSEVCTMQIVPVEFSGVIPVEPLTTTLAITVLDPEGQPKATGSVEIEKSDPGAAADGE